MGFGCKPHGRTQQHGLRRGSYKDEKYLCISTLMKDSYNSYVSWVLGPCVGTKTSPPNAVVNLSAHGVFEANPFHWVRASLTRIRTELMHPLLKSETSNPKP